MMFSKFVWILVIFCCNNPGCHAAELNDHSSSKLKDTQPSGSLPQTLSLSLNGGPYEVEKQANMLENSQLIITPSYLVSDRWNHTADHNGRQSRQNTPQTAALPLHPNNNVARPVGHGIKVEKQGRQTRQNTPASPFHPNNNVSRPVGHGIKVEKQGNMLGNSKLFVTPSYLVSGRLNHIADRNGRQSRQNTPQTAALPLHPNNNVARPVGHGIKVEKQGRQTRQNTPASPFHPNNNVSRPVGHGINFNAIRNLAQNQKPGRSQQIRNVLKTRATQRTVIGSSYTPRKRIPRDQNRPRHDTTNRNLTPQDHRRARNNTNRNKSQDPRPARYNTNSRAYVKKSQNLRPARYDYTNSKPYVNKSQNLRRLIKSEGPRRLNKSQDPRVPRQNPNRDLINIRSNSSNTSQDLRRISKRIPKREVIDIRSNSENKSPSGPPYSEAAHSNKENKSRFFSFSNRHMSHANRSNNFTGYNNVQFGVNFPKSHQIHRHSNQPEDLRLHKSTGNLIGGLPPLKEGPVPESHQKRYDQKRMYQQRSRRNHNQHADPGAKDVTSTGQYPMNQILTFRNSDQPRKQTPSTSYAESHPEHIQRIPETQTNKFRPDSHLNSNRDPSASAKSCSTSSSGSPSRSQSSPSDSSFCSSQYRSYPSQSESSSSDSEASTSRSKRHSKINQARYVNTSKLTHSNLNYRNYQDLSELDEADETDDDILMNATYNVSANDDVASGINSENASPPSDTGMSDDLPIMGPGSKNRRAPAIQTPEITNYASTSPKFGHNVIHPPYYPTGSVQSNDHDSMITQGHSQLSNISAPADSAPAAPPFQMPQIYNHASTPPFGHPTTNPSYMLTENVPLYSPTGSVQPGHHESTITQGHYQQSSNNSAPPALEIPAGTWGHNPSMNTQSTWTINNHNGQTDDTDMKLF
eukprot:881837_1